MESEMTLAVKIQSIEAEIVGAKDIITGLVKAAETDGRDLTEVEASEISSAKALIEQKEKSLQAYKDAEQSLAQGIAAPAIVKAQHLGTVKSRKGEEMLFAKMATAAFVAHTQGKTLESVVASHFESDRELSAVVKAETAPATTQAAGWAAELTRQGYADFMDALRPTSFYAQVAASGTAVQFGNNQSISLPSQAGSMGDLAGSFVGEGNLIPVKRTSYASKVLNRYKMGVISHFSKELSRVSVPSIQGLITAQIVADTAWAIDAALISANPAVPNKSPAGLLNGVTLGTSAGSTAADVLADIKALVTPIIQQNGNSASIVLLMNPLQELGLSFVTSATGAYMFRDQLSAGRLNGYKVIVSNNIPDGTVLCMDASSFASAFDTPEFAVSDTASLVQADDVSPDPSVLDKNNFGAVTTGKVVSLFQQELIAVRMTMPLSWMMRRDGFVTGITGVAW
jgi:HK97 family phage major capsid protein